MSSKVLPPMETTFSIKLKGGETGQLFEGNFTYKRPTLGKRTEISKTLARLNSDVKNLDDDTQFLHSMWSNLKHTLIKYPEWWEKSDFGYEMHDLNVVLEIFKKCREFEDEWFKKVWSEEEVKEDSKK